MEIDPKSLSTFGPFAILGLFVYILLGPMHESSKGGKVGAALYQITFGAILVLTVVDVRAWWKLNLISHEFIIKGRLIGLESTWAVSSPYNDMYIRRILNGHSKSDFAWRIISESKLPERPPVEIVVDRSVPGHEDVSFYQMPILSSFYEGMDVVLVYSPADRRLLLDEDGKMIELNTVPFSDVITAPSGSLLGRLGTVLAQNRDPLQTIAAELESNDALLRLSAREDLAKDGRLGHSIYR